MDCSPRDSSVHGILQARNLEWVACPPLGDLPYSGIQPKSLMFLACRVGSLLLVPPGKPTWTLLLQFSRSVVSDSLWPHGLQHSRLACPSPSPRACSNSSPLSQWCHPLISSSVVPFSFCLQSFPASGSFPVSQLCIRWPRYWNFSFSTSPFNEYSGLISFRTDWFDLLAVQGTLKNLLQHHNSKASILQHSAFFIDQLSHPYMTTGKTVVLTIQTFVSKAMSLLFNILSRFVIAFLPRSKHLLKIPWLQSLSTVILESKKRKPASTFSPYICCRVMGLDAMILVFWMLSFKSAFSLSSFTLIKRLFSSSSLSAIRVVLSAYLRLLIFLPEILILACDSSSLAFCMMYSACKLNKQGDNIQPWHTPFPILHQSVVSYSVLTVASWPSYRSLRRQIRWFGILISLRIFHSLLWSTQSKALLRVVNQAEVNVFLESPCFSHDPAKVGNLIPGSSDFSKPRLYMWKLSVHILWHCPSLRLEWKLTFFSPVATLWVALLNRVPQRVPCRVEVQVPTVVTCSLMLSCDFFPLHSLTFSLLSIYPGGHLPY